MATIEELTQQVAQLQAKMDALTTPPDDYYTHRYSGEEIDDGIDRAKAGGAIDTALAKKAPAGYGYGDRYKTIEATSASEDYDTFCAKVDAVIGEMQDRTCKQMSVYPPALYGLGMLQLANVVRVASEYVSVTSITNYDIRQCGWRMIKTAGVWRPIEFFYPPLTLGVEYRTTERYLGKPVYVKLVNFGVLPNAATKTMAHGIASLGYVVDIYGSGVSNQPVSVTADGTNISITDMTNLSTITAYPVLKYTKTTD